MTAAMDELLGILDLEQLEHNLYRGRSPKLDWQRIFGGQTIAQALRNQYSIAYHPSNQAKDGKFRKIKVELVNPENGEALKIVDEKHKPIKYSVIAKGGYTAPREVE